MKKIILFITIFCASLSFHSCADFLDVDKYFYDMLSVDSAFSKRVYVEGWLSNTYDYLKQDNLTEFGSKLMWASDDLVHPRNSPRSVIGIFIYINRRVRAVGLG